MAEAVVLAGLWWAGSPIVNKLLTEVTTYLGMDMARELQELDMAVLPQFELVIEAVEKSPHAEKLEKWLKKLKAAFYDAEDVLDEHEYNLLRREAKQGKKQTSARVLVGWLFNLLPENRRLLCRLIELKSILAEARTFRELLLGLQVGNAPERSAAAVIGPHTSRTSSLPTCKVFGRDKDRDLIVDLLIKPAAAEGSAASYLTLAIVGHGGAGKTTLAQYVYHDERVVKHFDVRMWVCISRKLDIFRHTREIIESALKRECPRVNNLDTLQCRLKDILLNSEKFLLVLDDVWFDESKNEIEWEELLAPLVDRPRGSKVLVTSRSTKLPAALWCNEVVHLEDMEDTEFLALFRHHAFAGSEIRELQLRKNLEEIAEKIAKVLRRSPLAAKAVGSQLSRKKDITAWKAALKNDKLSQTTEALLWSYQNLDPHIQRCFLFCSLFPKGYNFEIDELIHLWVAEGLVDLCDRNSRLEDIGKKYFYEMVSCSLFHPVSDRAGPHTLYNMHDLFHDLSEKLSAEDYFRLEDDKLTEIPCTARHLSVRVESTIRHKQSICKLHNLRTVICIDPLIDDVNELFHQILRNLKKVRVLLLCFYNGSKLPESVGELKHLRYLNLIKTSISDLPESLCVLYHLQLLQLNHKVESLPDKLCNLSKLCHLEGYHYRPYKPFEVPLPQIPSMGKLRLLQHIHAFGVRKQKGHELRQLRDMKELGGSLRITNLENVSAKDEALESMLYEKSHLERLQLVWTCDNNLHIEASLYLEVLEGLMPPPELKHLAIDGYESSTYPRWLLRDSYFENLESFELENCSALEGLPPNAQLLRSCQELNLRNIPNLKTLPCLPSSLKHLKIDGCPLLMFTSNKELEQHDQRVMLTRANYLTRQLTLIMEAGTEGRNLRCALSAEHSSLKHLMTLMDADVSEELQTIQRALQRDDVLVEENIIRAWLGCQEQRVNLISGRSIGLQLILPATLCDLYLSSCSITDEALVVCLGGLNSLRRLVLIEIMTLTTLPPEHVLQHSTMLKNLYVNSCWYLRSLGGLWAATSLSILTIIFCPSLELGHDNGTTCLPLSLECLHIHDCILGANFLCNDLPYLSDLLLFHCRSSASLSIGHLTSLKSFALYDLLDLFFIEGLSSLHLHNIRLINVPNFAAESFSQRHAWKSLTVSSSMMLNLILSMEGFTLPEVLRFERCNEPFITSEWSMNFTSLKSLVFSCSQIRSLPTSLKGLTSLESIRIIACPNVLSLPDLPNSVQFIEIFDCQLLKESCRAPNGENWPKIAHIRWKKIG